MYYINYMMTGKQIKDFVTSMIEKHNIHNELECEYVYYGLRFANIKLDIGNECEWSKHNPNRDDEREFPAYGTKEYDALPQLDGTSAYNIQGKIDWRPILGSRGDDAVVLGNYCYIIAGNNHVTHDDADSDEIVICDAVVIEVL